MNDAQTAAASAPEAIAPIQTAFQGFVGSAPNQGAQNNPHAYRYAYMPGVWRAKSEPLQTGYSFYPQGALIGFKTFTRGGLFDFVAGINASPPVNNKIGEISAEQALKNALTDYQAVEGFDNGFRAFEKLTGDPLAEAYFDALHPSFEVIGHECPRSLEVCPSCRKDVLPVSEKDVKDFLAIYNQKLGAGVPFDLERAKAVCDVIAESCSAFISTAGDMWRELSDQKERTRNSGQPCVLQPSHYHYRNVLHILDPMEFEEQKEQRLASMIANATQGKEADSGEVGELRRIIQEQNERLAALESKQSSKTKSKERTEDVE